MSTITNLTTNDNGADSMATINTNISNLNTDKLEASDIANLFDKTTDTLDDITAGSTNVPFTATDESKLDGIEAGATADQTGSEIKSLYEAEADTNAYTDAEKTKLAGIEAGAEANVVDSVNTQTGAVVLDADDIDDTSTTNKFVTSTDLTNLSNLSGTNSGDQDLSGLALKSNVLELDNTTAFTPDADYEPATKKYVDDNIGGAPEGTDVLSTGETGGNKFLREDGDGTCSWQSIPGGGDLLSTNNLSDVSSASTALSNLGGIGSSGVTYENLSTNGDIGTGSSQVAQGDHAHTGVYEPADSTILKEADVDDTPVDSATTAPISSNWAYDHENDDVHKKSMQVVLVASDTDLAADTSIQGDFRIPGNRAVTITAVGAYVDTAGTTGVTTIDINEGGTSILSTKITIDSGEKSSITAATAPVISDSAIAADAIITFDIDGISTTAPKGLKVWIEYIEN